MKQKNLKYDPTEIVEFLFPEKQLDGKYESIQVSKKNQS